MQVCKYFPVANDRMGTIWTLASIEGVCVIEFGPAGTTHYSIEAIGSLNGEERAKIYSTHMDQSDVTFGKYDRVENAIIELDENIKPKYIFVMASSISSIIGADIKSVCSVLKDKVKAKLIPITTGGLKEDYNVGIENTLKLLVKEITKENEKDINRYNIIGSNIDKYNFLSDTYELKRMMKDLFNKEPNTIFTSDTSIEGIENVSKASLNIVVRKEGLKVAQYMQEKYDIPYVYKSIYGLKNTIEFVELVNEIDGYKLNRDRFDKEVSFVKNNMFNVKRKFVFYKENKDCAVFADYDTTLGISDMLNELGLNVVRKEVLHKVDSDELIYGSELDRMKYLKNTELLGLFGDGPCLDMESNSKAKLQISNPNLSRTNIYPYTPYVGFRGCVYFIETILNIKL
ncbi:MAG: nitrogenase component 1 [Paraclostridium sp.]